MLDRIKSVALASLIVVSTLLPVGAMAQAIIYPAHITEVNSGWGDDAVGVTLDQPQVNPAKCPITDGIYNSPAGAGGNRTFLAAALTALANKLTVTVVVSSTQCDPVGRPYLIAVSPSAPQ
ncbi:hypothetical protein [Dyella silvae]|uniref:hypothetical protein n=1 Tax=Dyella silvae TaxID=2994424 RepID=UPI0022656E68|nr:hypothetical protein [Dyella silvae]